MELDYFLKKEQVVKLTADTKQGVIREMTNKLQDLGLLENASRYYAQVLHRESLENSGLGAGLAVPHARTESVGGFCSLFGITDNPIDYQSHDGEPVRYILLSVFPSSMSTKYLYFIGLLARLFSDPDKQSAIKAAGTVAKMYSFLSKEAEAYFKTIPEHKSAGSSAVDAPAGVPGADLDLLIRLDRMYQLYDSEPTPALSSKIENIKKLINKRSLTYYERMREKQNNPFSVVEKGACTGCHMEIPLVQLNEVKAQNNVPICSNCGRFLIVV